MIDIQNSLVIPIYKNEDNLDDLLIILEKLNLQIANLEVVFVVDGSPDKCFEILSARLISATFSSQLLLLSRNFGSFAAIRKGLEVSKGNYFAVMAADLQEPPLLIKDFFTSLKEEDVEVALGVRNSRNDESISDFFSMLFWTIFSKFVIKDVPKGGVDVFGCNLAVRDALLKLNESNTSLIGQLFWVGFKRKFFSYDRLHRQKGVSAWNFTRKLRYMLDSIFAFSDLPLLMLLWIGLFGIISSGTISIIVLLAWLFQLISVHGYTPIILSIYFIGSILIFGQGIIGCYVWRCAENTKQRPITLVARHDMFNTKI